MKRAGARPTLHRSQPAQLRSARAARSLVLLSVVLLPALPDAPMVLPLLLPLLEVSDEPLLAAGELDELELVLGELLGVLEDEDEEPLAPMVLGDEELDELDDGEEVLESLLPLALGLVVLPLVLGLLLEPEAPIELVERSLGLVGVEAPAVPPAAPAAGEAPVDPLLPELWAKAMPPNARAAAAARVVKVVLVALMLNSLIDMLGNAPAWRAGCAKIRRRLSTSEVGLERQGL
ncbi:hypothetical protein [Ramlibacter sp.]|uniref:hypothetical protein n=1 Tax=Ramlibacter sp. TaxID=1917967 RepID=UPI002D2D0AA5|nr:hypothetical protein [Ramlibacter sp.]HYD74738.1 hypothetical protein [Ramlibacter sp.]